MIPRLLVSVRSVQEAEIALDAGVDLVDIKEPAHGSMGAASSETINAIVEFTGNRCPLSAASGELIDESANLIELQLDYLKWGLAQCSHGVNWQQRLEQLLDRCKNSSTVVPVAYADAELAQSPPVVEVLEWACKYPGSTLLIDTWQKGKKNLLDWLTLRELATILEKCRQAEVQIALAGSLTIIVIRELIQNNIVPDWFAVRGAACEHGTRTSQITLERIRELQRIIRATQ